MRRKFTTNLALLLLLNLLIKPFWVLGIDREVQNVVGADEYGLYYALFNFSFLLNILLDLGITTYNNRNIARNSHLLTKYFSNIVVLKAFLGSIYVLVSFAIGFGLGYSSSEFKFLIFLACNQFLLSFILYLRSNLSGLHLFKTDSLVSVLDRFLMILFCGYLLWFKADGFKIEWFIYCQTLGYGITAIVAFAVVLGKAKWVSLKFDYTFLVLTLKQSFPYALLVLFMTLFSRLDTVMIERMLIDGKEQAGIYASAYRLLDAANMIALLFSVILLPTFARMLKNNESVEYLVALSSKLLLAPAIIVGVASFFYSDELMSMLLDHKMTIHQEESAKVFGLLMFCFIPVATQYIFSTLLTAHGSLKQLNYLAIFGIITNISLNILLIPSMKAMGSVVASLITLFIQRIAWIVLSTLIFKFRINRKLILSFTLFTIGVVGVNYASVNIKISGFSDNWLFTFSAMVVLCAIIAFLARLVNFNSILQILKYGKDR